MTNWIKRLWECLQLWGVSWPNQQDAYLTTAEGDRYRLLDVKASQGYDFVMRKLRPDEVLCRVVCYSSSPDRPCLYHVLSGKELEMHEEYNPQLAGVIWAPVPKRTSRTFRTPDTVGNERRRRITRED